jgi:glycosyltransferase involved in cell wall biosynthesis
MHGYNFLTHQLAALSQVIRHRPILVREEQTLLHRRAYWKQTAKKIGLGQLFRRAYGLYIGTQNRRWFEHYGIPDERLFFTPYCVDNDHFQAAAAHLAPTRHSLKQEFGIDDHAGPVILTVARLIPKKQPLFLLEAFRRVRQHHPCTLVIVGSGELENEIRTFIQDKAVPNVILTGFLNQSKVPRAYSCADIFVLASAYDETWGLVTNEAMNFGLPVVLSDKVGCGVDLVRPGENGFIVSATDPQPLADRLAELVADPHLRNRLGTQSRSIIDAWNYDVTAKGVLDAVASAVGSERWTRATAQFYDAAPHIDK